MTKMYKYLYKKMHDDLKDAEMLIDYACELKKEGGHDEVAKFFAESAVQRLSKSFKETHALFTTHATQEKGFGEETVTNCLWDVQHEQMMDWYDKIAKKIEKYK